MVIDFEAQLWVWDARRADTWTFVSLPVAASEELRDRTAGARRGFGSIRVRAAISTPTGSHTWTTSIFPDGRRGCYVLPVKRAVRTAARLEPGDTAPVRVEPVGVPP